MYSHHYLPHHIIPIAWLVTSVVIFHNCQLSAICVIFAHVHHMYMLIALPQRGWWVWGRSPPSQPQPWLLGWGGAAPAQQLALLEKHQSSVRGYLMMYLVCISHSIFCYHYCQYYAIVLSLSHSLSFLRPKTNALTCCTSSNYDPRQNQQLS